MHQHQHPDANQNRSEHNGHESFLDAWLIAPHAFESIQGSFESLNKLQKQAASNTLGRLEARFKKLSWITFLARRLLFGDPEARQLFHTWIVMCCNEVASPQTSHETENNAHPTHLHDHSHDNEQENAGLSNFSETLLIANSNDLPPIFGIGPIVDIFAAAAYDLQDNIQLIRQAIKGVQSYILQEAALVDLLYRSALRYAYKLETAETIALLLEEYEHGRNLATLNNQHSLTASDHSNAESSVLLDFNTFTTQLEFLVEVWPDQNAISAWLKSTSEVRNNESITDVTPDVALAGESKITLVADPKNPFEDTAPKDIRLFFYGGIQAEVESWEPTKITAKVPSSAYEGPVWLGRTLDEKQTSTILNMHQTIREGLRHGWGNSIFEEVQPIDLARPAFVHQDQANVATIVHQPEILRFEVYDPEGRRVSLTDTEAKAAPHHRVFVEPNTPLVLRWEVAYETNTAPKVQIRINGNPIEDTVPPVGEYTFFSHGSDTLSCSIEWNFRDLATTVVDHVSIIFSTPDFTWLGDLPTSICVERGATRYIYLYRSGSLRNPMNIRIENSNPAAIGAPGMLTIPAGVNGGQLPVTGLRPGRRFESAGTLTLHMEGHESRPISIWVENPEGDWDQELGARLNLVPIHAALLHTNRVVLFAYDENDNANVDRGEYQLWDPVRKTPITPSLRLLRNPFCSGHCLLPDGRLFVAGGHAKAQSTGSAIAHFVASIFTFGIAAAAVRGADHDIHVFDPEYDRSALFLDSGLVRDVPPEWRPIGTWARYRDMPAARWYPTCVTLPNGRVLIAAGGISRYALGGADWAVNHDYEIFDPYTGSLASQGRFHPGSIQFYPHMHVLPTRLPAASAEGVLFVHAVNETRLFNLQSRTWLDFSTRARGASHTYPHMAASVLLPIQLTVEGRIPDRLRILLLGGSTTTERNPNAPALNTAQVFEYDVTEPTRSMWRPAQRGSALSRPRIMGDGVLLPDGNVFLVNGAQRGFTDNHAEPVTIPEIFFTSSERFGQAAAMSIPRRYHSFALLLPDASVLVGGSTGGWPPSDDFEYRLSVYYPPYMFCGPRPVIEAAPSTLSYIDRSFRVTTANEQEIGSAALIRASSVTHQLNTDQRCLQLPVRERGSGYVEFPVPSDRTVAPPGYYLLFLLNRDRVPSIARFIHLS